MDPEAEAELEETAETEQPIVRLLQIQETIRLPEEPEVMVVIPEPEETVETVFRMVLLLSEQTQGQMRFVVEPEEMAERQAEPEELAETEHPIVT